jgi:hypothetical protein
MAPVGPWPASAVWQRDAPRKEKRRGMTAAFIRKSTYRSNYFETDFLNMRSIFSLICSIACEFC